MNEKEKDNIDFKLNYDNANVNTTNYFNVTPRGEKDETALKY